jgi:hypothetical protein
VEDERIPKKFLMLNFIIKDQRENKEQVGRRSSGGTHRGCWEYEEGGDEQTTEKNGGVV